MQGKCPWSPTTKEVNVTSYLYFKKPNTKPNPQKQKKQTQTKTEEHWHCVENNYLADSILGGLYWDELSLLEQTLGLTDLCSDHISEEEGEQASSNI